MQPQVVDPASRGICRLPNSRRDLMGFGWPSPYSTYVVPPPSPLTKTTTGRSEVRKPPASRPAGAPGVATPWFRAPSPARRAASIAACGFYATRHTQCRAGGAAVSCAAGSVCRRGWMSGRPENKIGSVHARDETTGPDDAVCGFGCFRRLALLRAASSARTTRTWRRRAGRAVGRRHQRSDYQRSIQISELCCPNCLHTSWFARPPSGGLEAATDYKQVLACLRA